ncbi:MAG: glutamyl-tRNA reductase, partial [Candidatus Delongbacteria bacterium]|nr:glutamyl-tRNA reductase [Candidatus Delongbacteria bacterium]
MRLEVIGINHTTSKVEVREKAAINSESLSSQLPLLTAGEEMEGAVILSTCNRTEFYLSPRTHLHKDSLRALFTRITNLDSTETANAYLFQDEAAVQHLFKVASGLNSQIVGETEILGQVKDAYYQALKLEQTNTVLNKVFLRAIECGKEVRHRTAITEGAVSVASAAAQLAGKIFGQLQAHNTLLVGAGATAQLVATHLQSNGAVNWRVSNRTPARAEQLAALLNGAVTVFPPTAAELAWADLVVCATSAPHHLISREMV